MTEGLRFLAFVTLVTGVKTLVTGVNLAVWCLRGYQWGSAPISRYRIKEWPPETYVFDNPATVWTVETRWVWRRFAGSWQHHLRTDTLEAAEAEVVKLVSTPQRPFVVKEYA